MAAQRSRPICKLPLWREKYDAVVKGHVRMDLEIEIAPGGDHPPGVLYFSRGCASGLFRLLTATPPSSCRPRSSRGLFYCWALIRDKQLAQTSSAGNRRIWASWMSTSPSSLTASRQARRAFPCCPISRQDITTCICWCKVWTLNLISFMAFLNLTTFRMGRAYRTGETSVVASKQLRHCVRATMPS